VLAVGSTVDAVHASLSPVEAESPRFSSSEPEDIPSSLKLEDRFRSSSGDTLESEWPRAGASVLDGLLDRRFGGDDSSSSGTLAAFLGEAAEDATGEPSGDKISSTGSFGFCRGISSSTLPLTLGDPSGLREEFICSEYVASALRALGDVLSSRSSPSSVCFLPGDSLLNVALLADKRSCFVSSASTFTVSGNARRDVESRRESRRASKLAGLVGPALAGDLDATDAATASAMTASRSPSGESPFASLLSAPSTWVKPPFTATSGVETSAIKDVEFRFDRPRSAGGEVDSGLIKAWSASTGTTESTLSLGTTVEPLKSTLASVCSLRVTFGKVSVSCDVPSLFNESGAVLIPRKDRAFRLDSRRESITGRVEVCDEVDGSAPCVSTALLCGAPVVSSLGEDTSGVVTSARNDIEFCLVNRLGVGVVFLSTGETIATFWAAC
jgi:hypothetical protein